MVIVQCLLYTGLCLWSLTRGSHHNKEFNIHKYGKMLNFIPICVGGSSLKKKGNLKLVKYELSCFLISSQKYYCC